MNQENNISGTAFTFMVIECETNPEAIGYFVKRNAVNISDQIDFLINTNLTLTKNFAEAVKLFPSVKIPAYTMFHDIWNIVNKINTCNQDGLIVAPVPLIIRNGICATYINIDSEEDIKEFISSSSGNYDKFSEKQPASRTTSSHINTLDFTQPWDPEENDLY